MNIDCILISLFVLLIFFIGIYIGMKIKGEKEK